MKNNMLLEEMLENKKIQTFLLIFLDFGPQIPNRPKSYACSQIYRKSKINTCSLCKYFEFWPLPKMKYPLRSTQLIGMHYFCKTRDLQVIYLCPNHGNGF